LRLPGGDRGIGGEPIQPVAVPDEPLGGDQVQPALARLFDRVLGASDRSLMSGIDGGRELVESVWDRDDARS
jgi:hypothetical protein